MTSKRRVLDTSALAHDPNILFSYPSDHLYVCLTVLEELDHLKSKKDKAVASEARMAIRMLEDIINGYGAEELSAGVRISTQNEPNFATLHIVVDTGIDFPIDERISPELRRDPDNRIINVALQLQKRESEQPVVIVSRDINLRLKAKTLGARSEDVPDEIKLDDHTLMYSGTYHIEGDLFNLIEADADFSIEDEAGRVYRLPLSFFGPMAQRNLYWYDDEERMGRIIDVEDDIAIVEIINNKDITAWGVKPKNIRQAIALHQLLSDDYDLNVLLGPAGSGKTFLAVAAALQLCLEDKRFKRIICVRSKDLMDDDIGHLPGTEQEKVAPLLGGISDSLIALHRDDENPDSSIEQTYRMAKIEFKSMAYMRGASISDAIIICDESQNMPRSQMKGLLSRAHSSSRVIVLANVAQIDNRFLTPLTSAPYSVMNTYRHYHRCSAMIFDKVERSPLAEFTEKHY